MTADRRPGVDRLADVVFYGPLGFVLDRRTLLPQLAKRGRRQVAFTKTIGRFTVRQGQERLTGVVSGLVALVAPPEDRAEDGPSPTGPITDPVAADSSDRHPAVEAEPDAADLAIPQYDTLSAIQVVPRLEVLDDQELDAISVYEAATRNRRTILAKINQLRQ